ncbi:MAG: transporter substrate-binding domain-containing protein [Sedimenticola sp.]
MNDMYRFISCVFFILIFFISSPVNGSEITIFGNSSKPPKIYLENNQPKGILVDILKYIDERVPVEFKIKLMPWKRAYQSAISSQGGVIGLSMNDERLKIFDYSESLFIDEIVMVVLKGNEFHYENIHDLKGKVVGLRRGASYGNAFEMGKQSIFRAEGDDSSKQRLLKLLSRRIDVAFINPGKVGVNNAIESDKRLRANRGKFVVLSTPFKMDPNHIGFAKEMQMEAVLTQINDIIIKGKESGDIQRIIDRHMAGPLDGGK